MKNIIKRSALILAICAAASVNLASCTTDGKLDQAKASAITNLALDYAVRTGKVSPSDAALVREVGTIVLTPATETPPVVEAPAVVTK